MALNLKNKFVNKGLEHLFEVNERKRVVGGKKGLHFDANTHTYTLDGVVLMSGTTVISRYADTFKRDMIAARMAKSNVSKNKTHLIEASKIKKYWSAFGERASALGTSGHAFCEAYWLSGGNIKPLHKIEENAKMLMDFLMENFEIVGMEEHRGNRRYMIGYTTDIEMISKKTGDYIIGDFKFASKFTNEQYKSIKGRNAGLLKAPFAEKKLRSIPKDKGEIQLSLYKRLLEIDIKVPVKHLFLFHIDGLGEEGNWYGDKGYKIYTVPDLQKEVSIMLEPHSKIRYDILDKL